MNKKVALSVLSATVFASMAASAFAAPKSGLYIGGNVDKYYSMNTLLGGMSSSALDQFSTEIGSAGFSNLIYVDFDGKGASIAEIMSATDFDSVKKDLTADKFEGVYSNIKADGSADGTYDPRNDAIDTPTGDLKVESVSAINAAKLTINFTQEMDATSVTTPANYLLDGVDLGQTAWGLSASDFKLSTDKKSVTINLKLNKALTNNKQYRLQVTKAVTNKAGQAIPAYDQFFNFADSAAPTVTTTAYTEADTTFTINFSEPLAANANTKVKVYDENNNDITGSLVSIASTQDKITVAASSLTAGKTYRVVMQGATDLSGNYFAGNKVEYTFKKEAVDTTKPTVVSLDAVSTKVVRAVFSEPVFIGAASKIAEVSLDGEDLSATPGAPTTTAVTAAANLTAAGNAVDVNGDGKTWDIAVVASGGTGLTGLHTVALTKVFDLQNNEIAAAYSKLVQFNADTTAPAVVSSTTAGTKLFLTVDEDATLAGATAITVLTPESVETSATVTPAYDNGNKKVVVIDLGATASKAGAYTVTLPKGLISDASGNSKAYTVSANFSPADTGKPTLYMTGSPATIDAGAVVQGTGNNIITVRFSEPVSATALDVNNYTVNGQKVFKSAVFTNSTKDTVKLTLNDNAISASGDLLVGVSGVADVAGNVMDAVTTIESLKENTAPTIASAKITSSTTITLTFSEAVTSGTASTGVIDEDDFNVYVAGSKVALASGASVANGVGANTLVLTLAAPITDLSKAIEVEASADSDVVDADKAGSGAAATGNALASGKVTVTQ
ncbi:Ig-like domain-containing protein [Brevibacillus centrosporus]|uniref:Ig-like domain-containing protein n=1 Tax=Brevibacillus centrosporus TaxID=54910 RepID=A0A1I3UPM5_9BACL|nr:Ig-like domain-containing protein [Brevibacillus centrosporus]SFJ83727.1 Ig-like domain-containing protein [Brevibacillus centrosporus]